MKTNLNACLLSFCLFCAFLTTSCDEDLKPEFEYPTTGFFGDNILLKQKTDYAKEENSLQAKIPAGQKLKVIITAKTPKLPFGSGGLWRITSQTNNLVHTKFDQINYSQIFQSVDGGLTCDQQMFFEVGTFQIDYYENDALTPTYSKTIVVNY